MKLPDIDSLETVEMIMAIEEVLEGVFGINAEIGTFDSPHRLVDWLEVRLSNRRPNKAATALLRKLAHEQQWPELAGGLDRPWRREQIAAIVREVFR